MNTDLILLKAQVEAMRNYFVSLLPVIFKKDEGKVWLAKYLMWKFERELLSPYAYTRGHNSLDQDKIDHRRFQLQVLMDIAYIQGGLEAYGILRKVDSVAAAQALDIYTHSDGSEETMLPLIDKIY